MGWPVLPTRHFLRYHWLFLPPRHIQLQVMTALETKDEMAARMDSIKNLKVQVGAMVPTILSCCRNQVLQLRASSVSHHAVCRVAPCAVPHTPAVSLTLGVAQTPVLASTGLLLLQGKLSSYTYRSADSSIASCMWIFTCSPPLNPSCLCRPSAASCAATQRNGGGRSARHTHTQWSALR